MKTINEVKAKICIMAAGHGWRHLKTQEWCINFYKFIGTDKAVINVYWNAKTVAMLGFSKPLFTVQTAISHPKRGKTQLNRRNVSLELLPLIFNNPRKHTGKGYY